MDKNQDLPIRQSQDRQGLENLDSFDYAQDKQSPEDIEERLKQDFVEKKKKKPMKVSGASVRDIQRIQEKRASNGQEKD
ncbi:MAG: hypothetical protein ABH837_01495 [bacterium]